MAGWSVRRLADAEVDRVGTVLGLARLHQGNGFYLVAWDGREPVGHAHLALTAPPELQDVEVREDYRRRGVASALCAAAEAEARAAGHPGLQVTVSAHSPGAQALYPGWGSPTPERRRGG